MIPVLNLKNALRHPTSPSQNGMVEHHRERSMLSGGDVSDLKTADLFGTSRSNNDLKDMLRSARDANITVQKLQITTNNSSEEMKNFTERHSGGDELLLTQNNK